MAINNQNERDNLLIALHKWARQQDENFTTEAFVHLLKDWISEQPKTALAVLGLITSYRLSLTEADCRELEIILQRRLDGNQPDIRIESRDRTDLRIIVEVKVEQPVSWSQIRNYSNELKDSQRARTCLTLLSRDLVERGPRRSGSHQFVRPMA